MNAGVPEPYPTASPLPPTIVGAVYREPSDQTGTPLYDRLVGELGSLMTPQGICVCGLMPLPHAALYMAGMPGGAGTEGADAATAWGAATG